MLRVSLGLVAMVLMCVATVVAAENKNKDNKDNKDAKGHKAQATITKVDAKTGTVTVKMKDKDGKEQERMFKLAEDVRYFDSTGKAVAIDVFRSGDYVLVVEQESHLKEMHKSKEKANPEKSSTPEKK